MNRDLAATMLFFVLTVGCGSTVTPATPKVAISDVTVTVAKAMPEESDAGTARISSTEDSATANADVSKDEDGAATAGASKRKGEDWPIFLGPHGTGISDETGLLDSWPEDGPKVIWDKRIGTGYSAPSVRGEKLVVHHRQRDLDIIECVRADDGAAIWKYEYDTDFSDPYGYNNGPRCSPLLTETLCYTFGAQGKLVCLNLEKGELVWERNTSADWKVPDQFFGAGCTPILEGDSLIVLVGGQPNSGVVAFDAATGKTKWESVGKDTWDGMKTDDPANPVVEWSNNEMLVSYSSPIAATIHGQRHLFCLMRQGLVSLDPETGRVRFKYWFRSRTHESVNAARPVIIDDKIFLSAAYETGMALLKVNPDGDSYEVVWRNKRGLSTHWSTAIHRDGCLYGFTGRHEKEGKLQCIEVASGDLLWETTGYDKAVDDLRIEADPATGLLKNADTGQVTAFPFFGRGSATWAEGKYLILGERGTMSLAKLDRNGWKEISRTPYKKLRYPKYIWPSPVIAHGRMYLRCEDWLSCFDVGKPEDAN